MRCQERLCTYVVIITVTRTKITHKRMARPFLRLPLLTPALQRLSNLLDVLLLCAADRLLHFNMDVISLSSLISCPKLLQLLAQRNRTS